MAPRQSPAMKNPSSSSLSKDNTNNTAAAGKAPKDANDTFERVDSVMAGEGESFDFLSSSSSKDIIAVPTPDPAAKKAVGPNDPRNKVRVVQLHEWKAAARSLAEAFAKDASSLYLINTPDRAHWTPEQKWDLHLRIMEYITYAHLLKGLVLTCGPQYDCVALWLPPGAHIDSLSTTLRSGLWRLTYLLSGESRTRFFTEFMPLLHNTKLSVLGPRDDADSYYLVYIGTKPSGRGKGYARKVIEEVTKGRADVQGKRCYLESTDRANVGFYGRLGFRGVRKVYLQRDVRGNVEMEVMVREPVSGGVERIKE